MGAQSSHRQVWLRPGRQHQLELGRRMVDEPPHTGPGRHARQPVVIIQDERHLTLAVQLVDQTRQNHLNHRCHDRIRRHRPGDGGAGPAERPDRMRPQDYRVVVALVERQPRHRFPRRLGLAPRRQKGRLPEARRAGDQSEPAIRPATKTLQKTLAPNRLLAHGRRMQLRGDQDRLLRTRSPTVARGESLAVQRRPGGPPALPDAATGSTPAHCRTTPSQGTSELACRMRSPESMGRKSLPRRASLVIRRQAARFGRRTTPHWDLAGPANQSVPATRCPAGRGDARSNTGRGVARRGRVTTLRDRTSIKFRSGHSLSPR